MQNLNSSLNNNSFDIVICGAGLIGACLALALAPLSLRVAVTEALPLNAQLDLQADGRSLALNYASVKILEAIGVWPLLKKHAEAIKMVHVSEQGYFGKLRFKAEDEQVDALGFVVPAPLLGAMLNQALLAQSGISVFNPARVSDLVFMPLRQKATQDPSAEVTLQTDAGEQKVTARLVIAADGVNSSLRELMGITAQTKNYGQSALATRVTTTLPLNNVAYERFIQAGALALLPLAAKQAALIVTGSDSFIHELQSLDDNSFLRKVQNFFGQRLGNFLRVEKRHVYPLKSVIAEQQVKANFILLGNAAHAIHPIAAQGFNFGLQDVALLAELITKAVADQCDFTELSYLQAYEEQRKKSQRQIINFTHHLLTIFSPDFLPLTLTRSAALKFIDLLPPLKHRLAKRLMGILN